MGMGMGKYRVRQGSGKGGGWRNIYNTASDKLMKDL